MLRPFLTSPQPLAKRVPAPWTSPHLCPPPPGVSPTPNPHRGRGVGRSPGEGMGRWMPARCSHDMLSNIDLYLLMNMYCMRLYVLLNIDLQYGGTRSHDIYVRLSIQVTLPHMPCFSEMVLNYISLWGLACQYLIGADQYVARFRKIDSSSIYVCLTFIIFASMTTISNWQKQPSSSSSV